MFYMMHNSPTKSLLNPLVFQWFTGYKARATGVLRNEYNSGRILLITDEFELVQAVTDVS
jgi:hypothetical protein